RGRSLHARDRAGDDHRERAGDDHRTRRTSPRHDDCRHAAHAAAGLRRRRRATRHHHSGHLVWDHGWRRCGGARVGGRGAGARGEAARNDSRVGERRSLSAPQGDRPGDGDSEGPGADRAWPRRFRSEAWARHALRQRRHGYGAGDRTMRIAVIPGDGIGVDTTAEALKVLRTVANVFGRAIDLETLPWGADYFLTTGVTIPANGYAMLREFAAIFIGALGDPRVPDNRHARDILLGTRFELDLYVNYRPVRLLDARLCPLKDRTPAEVNFVVFRENTEGLYVSV